MNRENARKEALKNIWVRVVLAVSMVCLCLTLVSYFHREVVHPNRASVPYTGMSSGTLHGPFELSPDRYRVTFSTARERPTSGTVSVIADKRKPDTYLDLAGAPRIVTAETTISRGDSASYNFNLEKAGNYYVLMEIPYTGGWSANQVRVERWLWPNFLLFLIGALTFGLLGLGLLKAQVKLLTGEAF